MADFRLEADFLGHHKIKKLRARLGPDGVVSWLGLIAYAATNRPDGRLDGLDREDLALVADWRGDQNLIDTLLELRLLDEDNGVFLLHNWSERQPWLMSTKARQEKARAAAEKRWEKRSPLRDGCSEHASIMRGVCTEHADRNAPLLSFPLLSLPKRTESSADAECVGNGEREIPKRRSKKRHIHPLPESWSLTPELRAYAAKHSCNPDLLAEEMRDWAAAKAELRADWDATYRSFVRRGSQQPNNNGAHRNGAAAKVPSLPTLDELDARDAAMPSR